MKSNIVGVVIIMFVSALMFVACGSGDKGPAELAIKAAEEAFNASKSEAAKYLPDEVKSLEGALAAAKDKLAKGEYKSAITEAQSITEKAKGLLDAAKAKKEELTKSWTDLGEGVPKMVEAIQSRVDILSKSKKLPANLTAEKFEDAKSGLAAAKEEWGKALESFKAGNLAEAVSMAKSVKDKAVATMDTLGMPVPAGAK
jgi:chromosome segregation ATPase